MQIFKPKTSKSLQEKTLIAERREIKAMTDKRVQTEQNLKGSLDTFNKQSKEFEKIRSDSEREHNEKIKLLQDEISKLEAKKRELETSADEVLFQKRRGEFYKLEEEVVAKRDQLAERLLEADKSKQSMAFIIQEHEEEYESLSSMLSERESKIVRKEQDLDSREENIILLEQDLFTRKASLDAALQKAYERELEAKALISTNKTFKETLEGEKDQLDKDRRTLQDAYKELEKSRERILGRKT